MSFFRLHVISEGATERLFVEKVLSEYLASKNIIIDSRSVLTGKNRKTNYEHRGGMIKYSHLKKDIDLWLKQDKHDECLFTTMIDLYGLPNDFPGIEQAQKIKNPIRRLSF